MGGIKRGWKPPRPASPAPRPIQNTPAPAPGATAPPPVPAPTVRPPQQYTTTAPYAYGPGKYRSPYTPQDRGPKPKGPSGEATGGQVGMYGADENTVGTIGAYGATLKSSSAPHLAAGRMMPFTGDIVKGESVKQGTYRPPYEPTWWENPYNVARAYWQMKSLPPGAEPPAWMNVDQIESAYKYFEYINRDPAGNATPWVSWKYANTEDPVRSYLQGMALPDAQHLLPAADYQTLRLYEELAKPSAEYNFNGLPPAYAYALQGQQYSDQLAAWQQEQYENLPEWQKLMLGLQDTTTWQGKLGMTGMAGLQMGTLGLITGGPMGGLAGLAAGVGLGGLSTLAPEEGTLWAALDYAKQGGLAGGARSFLGITGLGAQYILGAFNLPASFLEETLGVGLQFAASAYDPERYGDMQEVIDAVFTPTGQPIADFQGGLGVTNVFGQAGLAARGTFESGLLRDVLAWNPLMGENPLAARLATSFFAQATGMDNTITGRMLMDPGNLAAMTEWIIRNKMLGEDTELFLARENQAWILGSNAPVTLDATSTAALVEFRRRLANGEDPELIAMETMTKFGVGGQFMDLLGNIVLDPLNVFPQASTGAMAKVGQLTGDRAMELSFRTASEAGMGPTQGWRRYTASLRTGLGGPADQLTGFQRMVAGLDETGRVRAWSDASPDNPLQRAWAHVFGMTPEAKFRSFVATMSDGLAVMLDMQRGDPDAQFATFKRMAEMAPTEAAKVGEYFGSPEMYSGQRAFATFTERARLLLEEYHAADAQRGILLRLSEALGEKPGDFLARLENDADAAGALQQIRDSLVASGSEGGRALVGDIDSGAFKAQNLVDIGKTFLGENATPWHPDEWQARFWGAASEAAGEWAVKAFGVAPSSAVMRVFDTMKKAQSIVLLGMNPGYLINNAVNNVVTRAAAGVFGFADSRTITRFLDRLGIEPYRFDVGIGVADIHPDIGPITEGVAGVGKPIGGAYYQGAENVVRSATRVKGPLERVNRALDRAGKFAPFTEMARNVERSESRQAFYHGMRQAYDGMWRQGRGYKGMPPGLQNALKSIDPRLVDIVYNAVNASMSAKEIQTKLEGVFQSTVRYSVDQTLPDVARQLGISETIVRDTLRPVMDDLSEKVTRAKTPTEVQRAFQDINRKINERIDGMAAKDLANRAAQVGEQTFGGGMAETVRIFDDLYARSAEHWMDHWLKWEETYDRASRIRSMGGDDAVLYRDASVERNKSWSRERDFERASMLGILDGLKFGDERSRTWLTLLDAEHRVWGDFFERKEAMMKEFTSTKYESDTARGAAWKKMQAEANRMYQAASKQATIHRQGMSEIFVEHVRRQFGDAAGERAAKYRKTVDGLSAKRSKMIEDFRRSLEGLTFGERRERWQYFLDQEYLPFIRDFFKAETDGAHEMFRGTMGDPNGTITPEEPTPPAPKGGTKKTVIDVDKQMSDHGSEAALGALASKYGVTPEGAAEMRAARAKREAARKATEAEGQPADMVRVLELTDPELLRQVRELGYTDYAINQTGMVGLREWVKSGIPFIDKVGNALEAAGAEKASGPAPDLFENIVERAAEMRAARAAEQAAQPAPVAEPAPAPVIDIVPQEAAELRRIGTEGGYTDFDNSFHFSGFLNKYGDIRDADGKIVPWSIANNPEDFVRRNPNNWRQIWEHALVEKAKVAEKEARWRAESLEEKQRRLVPFDKLPKYEQEYCREMARQLHSEVEAVPDEKWAYTEFDEQGRPTKRESTRPQWWQETFGEKSGVKLGKYRNLTHGKYVVLSVLDDIIAGTVPVTPQGLGYAAYGVVRGVLGNTDLMRSINPDAFDSTMMQYGFRWDVLMALDLVGEGKTLDAGRLIQEHFDAGLLNDESAKALGLTDEEIGKLTDAYLETTALEPEAVMDVLAEGAEEINAALGDPEAVAGGLLVLEDPDGNIHIEQSDADIAAALTEAAEAEQVSTGDEGIGGRPSGDEGTPEATGNVENEVAPLTPAEVADMAVNLARQQVGVITRDKFQDWMMETFFKDAEEGVDQALDVMTITDARAEVWSANTGRPPEDWYTSHIRDLREAGSPDENALMQTAAEISARHGGEGDAQRLFQDPLFQGANASTHFEDGQAIITALSESRNVSSMVHELAHVFRRDLGELSPELVRVAEEWCGVEGGEWNPAVVHEGDKWFVQGKEFASEEMARKYAVRHEEKFARGFERYLADGIAPSKGLKMVFERFGQWLAKIYAGVMDKVLPKVTPEMRRVYDALLEKYPDTPEPVREAGPAPIKPAEPATVITPDGEQFVMPGTGVEKNAFNWDAQKATESVFKTPQGEQTFMPGMEATKVQPPNPFGVDAEGRPTVQFRPGGEYLPQPGETVYVRRPDGTVVTGRVDVVNRGQAIVRTSDGKSPVVTPKDMRPIERSVSSGTEATTAPERGAEPVGEAGSRGVDRGSVERVDTGAARTVEPSTLPKRVIPGTERKGTIDRVYLQDVPEPSLTAEFHNAKALGVLNESIGQVTDAKRILSAFQRGEKAYILGNGTGTGKTYVGNGVISEMQPKRALIVVPNQNIATGWRRVGQQFGNNIQTLKSGAVPGDGVYVTTYSTIGARFKEGSIGQFSGKGFDLVIFDESHKLKNYEPNGSVDQANAAMGIMQAGDPKVVFSSATPFQGVPEMQYLERMGMWREGEFNAFALDHGYTWVDSKYGGFWRFVGEPDDILRAYVDMRKRGVLSTRELAMDVDLENEFVKVSLTDEIQNAYASANDLVDNAVDMLHPRSPHKGMLEAQRTLINRRIMEVAKVDTAIEQAKQLAAEGRQVAIFTGYRNEAKPPNFKGFWANKPGYYGGETINGLLAKVYDLVDSEASKSIERLVAALGGERNVAQVHGGLSTTVRDVEIDAYNSGKKKFIVATAAAGGTGLSLHDIQGGAPRAQVNIYLPWSGQDFMQVAGRSYRFGSKTDVKQKWLFADTMKESKISAVVGGRLQEMGALVNGIVADTNANKIAAFDFGMLEDPGMMNAIENAQPPAQRGETAGPFFQENITPAMGPYEPGMTESVAAPFYPWQMEADGWRQRLSPILSTMEDQMLSSGQRAPIGDMPKATADQLSAWLRGVNGDMASTKRVAMSWGEKLRDEALLNYSDRRGFDQYLNMVYPYQFWYTRTALNWAMRMIDRPAWYANWARLRNFFSEREQSGMPSRLNNKMDIPMPFLPEWTGGKVFVDPMRKIFPFEEFTSPIDNVLAENNSDSQLAQQVLAQWVSSGRVQQAEALQAAQTRTGSLWNQAMSMARAQAAEGESNPMDFATMMMSPALWITLPYFALTGKTLTGEDDMGLMPFTRTGQAIQAVTRNTPVEALGNLLGGLMAAPEGAIRKMAGLSEFGAWGDYYVDRMMSNMAAEGTYSTKEVLLAMSEHQGPIYDEARQRVQLEMALRTPGALPTYAALHGAAWNDPAGMLMATLFGWLPAGLYPEGEMEQRGLADEWKAARNSYNAGNKEAINDFFERYPEYEARLALYDEPEDRLRQFMISELWERYSALGSAEKQEARAALGERFTSDFLEDETRNYDLLDVPTLAAWTRSLGGTVPDTDTTQMDPDIDPSIQYSSPQVRAVVNSYRAERNETFPNWYALQSAYYNAPPAQRPAFMAQFPELKEYWDWNSQYKQQHPEVAQYTASQQQAAADTIDYSFFKDFSTPVASQVMGWVYAGQTLTSGVLTELRYIWENHDKPGGTFDEFLVLIQGALAP